MDRLGELAGALASYGLSARLVAPFGRLPNLYVLNPVVPRLSEHVYAAPDPEGTGWFWWPWAERIAPDSDVAAAAAVVARVLRVR
jgi:hypothetical protein